MTDNNCLRCSGIMQPIGVHKIQLGEIGFLTGTWSNLMAGALEVEIHICTKCGKVDFYANQNATKDESLPQSTCPNCGRFHDFDFPKCPHCKYDCHKIEFC